MKSSSWTQQRLSETPKFVAWGESTRVLALPNPAFLYGNIDNGAGFG
ncbi:MAG TPA: hypothetical protein VJO16_19935 [Candidatus Acidoferrum sp.]|nr:hypothetical protein [Candidatus Acidoferrum sp.]